MSAKQKLGRPANDSPRRGPETRKFTIVLDDEVELALVAIARAVDPDVRRGRRSIAVRKAILDAADRLGK